MSAACPAILSNCCTALPPPAGVRDLACATVSLWLRPAARAACTPAFSVGWFGPGCPVSVIAQQRTKDIYLHCSQVTSRQQSLQLLHRKGALLLRALLLQPLVPALLQVLLDASLVTIRVGTRPKLCLLLQACSFIAQAVSSLLLAHL